MDIREAKILHKLSLVRDISSLFNLIRNNKYGDCSEDVVVKYHLAKYIW
ncbi:hypothetical protein [Mycoplasma sp. SG1]|nr:hypothetical protein [Mycoplasma sp. SG1]URM52993.1 hypothetical protein JRW51_01445 [Mycoplasma sp. SG1]